MSKNAGLDDKQCRPWSDAAFCSIWSGSTLFAQACLSQYYGSLRYQWTRNGKNLFVFWIAKTVHNKNKISKKILYYKSQTHRRWHEKNYMQSDHCDQNLISLHRCASWSEGWWAYMCEGTFSHDKALVKSNRAVLVSLSLFIFPNVITSFCLYY